MLALRKISLLIALMGFSAFFSLSIAENFHHHGDLESHDDCAMCSWEQIDSKAVTPTIPALLLVVFAVLALEMVSFPWFSFKLVLASGRSPPISQA